MGVVSTDARILFAALLMENIHIVCIKYHFLLSHTHSIYHIHIYMYIIWNIKFCRMSNWKVSHLITARAVKSALFATFPEIIIIFSLYHYLSQYNMHIARTKNAHFIHAWHHPIVCMLVKQRLSTSHDMNIGIGTSAAWSYRRSVYVSTTILRNIWNSQLCKLSL